MSGVENSKEIVVRTDAHLILHSAKKNSNIFIEQQLPP